MKLVPAHVEGARGMLKMSQDELAKATGLRVTTISYFESGKTVPHDSTLRKIQEALEQRGIEFMNGDEPGVRLRPSKAVITTQGKSLQKDRRTP